MPTVTASLLALVLSFVFSLRRFTVFTGTQTLLNRLVSEFAGMEMVLSTTDAWPPCPGSSRNASPRNRRGEQIRHAVEALPRSETGPVYSELGERGRYRAAPG